MPTWLMIAKGPVARFTLVILVLGLLRLAVLTIWEMLLALRQAQDHNLPYRRILGETLGWLLPVARLHRSRWVYSFASFGFHLGILVTGFFLVNHIDIVRDVAGLSWSAIYKPVLDVFALLTISGGLVLLFYRMYVPGSRALSKAMDYILLWIILNIFISGYLAGRPWNPIAYDALMLFHTLNGILLLLVAPFTKIAHCVLFPLIRLASQIAWQLKPQGGSEVVRTLHGPEGRQI